MSDDNDFIIDEDALFVDDPIVRDDALRTLVDKWARHIEDTVRTYIAAEDWNETFVLDFIIGHRDGTQSLPEQETLVVKRYRHEPPSTRLYGNQFTDPMVVRVTEQRCRDVGIDPETGTDIHE